MIKLKAMVIGGAAVAAVAFLSGWQINGWRLESNYAEKQIAAVEEWDRLNKEAQAKWKAQAEQDMEARLVLAKELQESQAVTLRLQDELDRAELVSVAPVIIEKLSECPTREEIETVVVNHNPFTADFVRLWNSSSRGADPGPDPPIATD